MRAAVVLTSMALLFGLAGCPSAPVRPPPPPPPSVAPPPPLLHVPPGCEANLAGVYSHRDDATFRYRVADDGLTLRIHAFRQYGATVAELGTGGDIVLRRTATGIHGEAVATARDLQLEECPVTFPYELTDCTDQTLTLRTARELVLGDACHVDVSHLSLVENVLVRVGRPDAGSSADAGAAPAGGQGGDGGESADGGGRPDGGAVTATRALPESGSSDGG